MNQLIRISTLAAVIMFAVAGNAQQSALDSMLLIVEKQQGEQKVHTLINISRQYFIAQDDHAIKYARDAVKLSESISYKEGAGKAMLFLGLAWHDIEPDTALHYYLKSSDILVALDHPWAYYGYKNASDIYISKGWYPEALQYVIKVFEINQKSGDTIQMVESLSNLGYLHHSIRNFDEAFHWQRKALTMLGDIENNTKRGVILGRIGINHDETGNYDSALYYNNLAIDLFRKAEENVYMAQWMSNNANTYVKLNKFEEAEKLLLEAMHLNPSDDRKSNIFNNLAKVYIETNRYDLARKVLDSAFYYAGRFEMKDMQSESWYRKYELFKALGKERDALEAYIQYSLIKDSILNETKTSQIAQMLVRYEVENKEKALLFEKAEKARIEKEKIQAQLSANRTRKWIYGVSFLTTLIILIGLLFMFRIKRKALLEKNRAIIDEQERGLTAIINAQEEEHKKIAKDLHDGIGQQISAVSLNFQSMTRKLAKDFPELSSDFEKIKRMILDMSEDIRSISHQMMPRALTHYGLVDALEDIIEISFKNSSIDCKFSHQNMSERLPLDIEIGIYRIAQELISNVIKHANASSVHIQLYRTNKIVVLSVEDDGIGFVQGESQGMGITNINSRVNALKGNLKLESKPGKGTQAIVKINL